MKTPRPPPPAPPPPPARAVPDLDSLVRSRRVLVLCGAGGVGKTTTSAALALAGVRAGRKVLVLTIDPARRLAEALGLPPHAARPVEVAHERLVAAGLSGPGTLHAWMLDPRVVLDSMVRRMVPDQAERLFANRLYRHLQDLVAGMQEHMASEALHELAQEDWDLVVVDTPPSRNALDFLDAPARAARFLEDGVIHLFLPKPGGGGLLRRAGRLVGTVFSRLLGEDVVEELTGFFGLAGGMLGALRRHTDEVRALLSSDEAEFLLVTSPEEEALREALFFREQILQRGMPFAGFVLNRSLARLEALVHPADFHEVEAAPPAARAALSRLARLAERERDQSRADQALLRRLEALAGPGRLAVAAPHLGDAVEDLPGLLLLARGMAG